MKVDYPQQINFDNNFTFTNAIEKPKNLRRKIR